MKKLELNGINIFNIYNLLSIISTLGNNIGETNIELIKEVLEAKGHEDILGSLSDDEGDEDDEDKDDDEDENSEPDENHDPSEEVPAAGVSEDLVHEATAFTAVQQSPVCMVIVYNDVVKNVVFIRWCH